MSLRLVRWIGLLTVCLLFTTGLMAQPWHQLTIDDFQGTLPATSATYIAYTNCRLHYDYDVSQRNGQYALTFYVSMTMNHSKSWMNKDYVTRAGMLNEVLQHEQGHYNMAYLEQQELMQAFNQARYGSDYRQQVEKTFNAIDHKYRTMNEVYEQETQHMLNREQQQKWNTWFKNEANSYHSYAFQQ